MTEQAICHDWDEESRTLHYANAGHPAPLLLRAASGALERLASNGIVIGLVEEASWRCDVTRLDPGDVLLAFSDGLTEACDRHGEEFGENRAAEALRRHACLPVEELMEAVVRDVEEFAVEGPARDDLTVVVAKAR